MTEKNRTFKNNKHKIVYFIFFIVEFYNKPNTATSITGWIPDAAATDNTVVIIRLIMNYLTLLSLSPLFIILSHAILISPPKCQNAQYHQCCWYHPPPPTRKGYNLINLRHWCRGWVWGGDDECIWGPTSIISTRYFVKTLYIILWCQHKHVCSYPCDSINWWLWHCFKCQINPYCMNYNFGLCKKMGCVIMEKIVKNGWIEHT